MCTRGTHDAFHSDTLVEIPKGFELQKNVHIRYNDPSLLDRIVTAAARQEIYDIVKVDYFVKDPEAVYTQLRDATFKYLKKIENQYKTIGIDLGVTPHINPENFVLMEITQSADDVGGNVLVDGNEVPIIQKREISATVGVKDRETVVLGGLVRDTTSESTTKIPILGDIPLLGWLFSSRSNEKVRQELVVLLTPYVLNNTEEAITETNRRFSNMDSSTTEWPSGWSLSDLANDEPEKDAWKNKKNEKADEE